MSRPRTPNTHTQDEATTSLSLPQGGTVLVDNADYELVRHLRWQRGARGHVVAHDKGLTVSLGRVVLGVDRHAPVRVVHKNGSLLDNRRANLETVPWPPCQVDE